MRILYLAPEGFDYLSNQLTEGFYIWGAHDFHCTNKVVHHGSMIEGLGLVNKDACLKKIHEYDMILISSGGDMRFIDDLNRIPKQFLNRVVFVDGSDTNAYLVDPSKIFLYLKRELRYPEANNLLWDNVQPLQFGVYQFHLEYEGEGKLVGFDDRDIDVSFVAFGGSSPMRKRCAEELLKLDDGYKKKVVVSDKDQPLTIGEYRDVCRRSKVIVSVPGAGIDTLRYWEAMGFGAVLCSVDVTKILQIPNAPLGRVHCLYFDQWETMRQQIKTVVKSKSMWNRLVTSAYNLCSREHMTVARAEQVVKYFNRYKFHYGNG